jgi:hypothetical protein
LIPTCLGTTIAVVVVVVVVAVAVAVVVAAVVAAVVVVVVIVAAPVVVVVVLHKHGDIKPFEDGQLIEICKGSKHIQIESHWTVLTIIVL